MPAKWNSIETISAVSIQGTDEIEYDIADGEYGKALIELCGQRIKAGGPVEVVQGRTFIDIREYELMPPE